MVVAKKNKNIVYRVKRCPECFKSLALDSAYCHFCGQRVGEVDWRGVARKPVNWQAYFMCVLSWAFFFFYCWWAFFRKKGGG